MCYGTRGYEELESVGITRGRYSNTDLGDPRGCGVCLEIPTPKIVCAVAHLSGVMRLLEVCKCRQGHRLDTARRSMDLHWIYFESFSVVGLSNVGGPGGRKVS
jgi:hypothetical protein